MSSRADSRDGVYTPAEDSDLLVCGVRHALEDHGAISEVTNERPLVIDTCCGSSPAGNAALVEGCRVIAVDIHAPSVIRAIHRDQEANGPDETFQRKRSFQMSGIVGSVLAPLRLNRVPGRVLITCNPPYLSEDSASKLEERRWTTGGTFGMEFAVEFIDQLEQLLQAGHRFHREAEDVETLLILSSLTGTGRQEGPIRLVEKRACKGSLKMQLRSELSCCFEKLFLLSFKPVLKQ